MRLIKNKTQHRGCDARNTALLAAASLVALVSGCGTTARQESAIEPPTRVAKAPKARPRPPAATPTLRTPHRGGGYYLDDGPGDSPPADLDSIPEPVPQLEPLNRATMRPYVVLGQTFTPMTELQPYKARGTASWYGRRYHGKQTSNGEIYDMYGISAAHPTLPIPSYARVTHLASGKSIVVRVNDRGPFLEGRLIDLSYTAAHRLGVLGGGSAMVEVETIIPDASGGTPYIAARPASPSVAPRAAGSTPPPPRPYAGNADPILALAAAANEVDIAGSVPRDSTPAVSSASARAEIATLDRAGVYLQLGAFGSRENAESYLERAREQFGWLAERLQVRAREGLYRVHAGPYASTGDAKNAAERIASSSGVKPVVTR